MRFDLAAMAARNGYRRKVTPFRAIIPPKAMAHEMERIYLEAIAPWQRAAPKIAAEYALAYSAMQHDRKSALETDIDEAEQQADNSTRNAAMTAAILALLLRYEKWHRLQWVAMAKRSTVDLTHFLASSDVRRLIDVSVARNSALVRSISDEASAKIRDAVFRGLQSATPISEAPAPVVPAPAAAEVAAAPAATAAAPEAGITTEIAKVLELAKKRAAKVADDQITKVSAALDVARMVQAGIDEYTWRHTPQAHPRTWHLARDGRTFKLSDLPGDSPGDLPYCKCYRMAVLRLPGKNNGPSVNI